MRGLRGGGRLVGAALWGLAMLPVLALGPASVLDRGPDGPPRVTPFPLALAALDPYVWVCVRNSVLVAAAVTLAARVLAVPLARVVVGWRFWGRRPLVWLACAGLAVPPAFGAVGLRAALAGVGVGLGVDMGRYAPALRRLGPGGAWSEWGCWAAWFWVALAAGAPLVALAAAAGLNELDPAWADAAGLAGARPRRVWRQTLWPVVRPGVARALALVFGLTLLDPGAPLVLGLRRTLGVQITLAARSWREPGQLSRAVVLALLGTVVALVARELIRGLVRPQGDGPPAPPRAPARASLGRGLASVVALTPAAAFVWVPLVALAAASVEPASAGSGPSTFRYYAEAARDPLTRQLLRNTAVLAVAVVVVDLALARALLGLTGVVGGRAAGLARWAGAVPPLAVGVGMLAVPVLLGMAADAAPGGPVGSTLARVPRWLAGVLDVDRTPGLALVLAAAVARVSLAGASAVDRRRQLRPAQVDALRVLGASEGRARRALAGGWFLGAAPAAALLTLVLAATDVAPALVLSPTAESRPVGPAVVALADRTGDGLPRAAALAAGAVVLNLAALAVAARARAGLVGAWLRT